MHREETIIRSIKKNSRNGTVNITLITLKSAGSGPANTAPLMLKSTRRDLISTTRSIKMN